MSIVRTLLPSAAIDYVAIFDENLAQVFREARALKATVKETSELMKHPLETGSVIIDHRIILPIEIDLAVVIQAEDYQSVYQQIREYYQNGTFLIIQTRTGVYENMVIASMPHDESPEMYDTVPIALRLREVQFVEPQYGIQPAAPSNQTTVDRGTQQGSTPTVSQTGAAQDIFYGNRNFFRSFTSKLGVNYVAN